MKWSVFAGALLATALSLPALADDMPPPGHGPAPMMISPQQAVALCQGRPAGAPAQWTAPDGRLLKGRCQIAFVPERPMGPPEETR
jgi:hypothetical protein